MPITKQNQFELDEIYTQHKRKYEGRKEDYFALLYLTKKFKLEPGETAHQIAFGGNDYGIDAFHFDRETRNLYLYQFKWSEDYNQFKGSLERLTEKGMRLIFENSNLDSSKNDVLSYLNADLEENKNLVERVYIHFVFKGDSEAAEKSSGLASRKELLENKQYFVEKYFSGRDVKLVVEFVAEKKVPSKPTKSESHQINFENYISLAVNDQDKELYVGFIPIMDVYSIYKSLGQRFFDSNIRASLSHDNPPNRKIREALGRIGIKKVDPPEIFGFNHNGITLVVERIDFKKAPVILHSPRLINGAQSISSLAKFFEEIFDNPNKEEIVARISEIKILSKIIRADTSSAFVKSVTIANNQQNPVDPWNLHANDIIHCDLQDKFAEEVQIYYSRQENSFQNLSQEELEERGIEHDKDIQIKTLAQTFLAVKGEVDNISRLRDVFENQSIYESIFNDACLKWDSRKIILGYKTILVLNSVLRAMSEQSTEMLNIAIKQSRNVILALLIQGVLNDKKVDEWAENFGKTLTKEVGYKEFLKTIAIKKILVLLRIILAEEEYKKRMREGRYAFLKSRDFYKKCTQIAFDKWGWSVQKQY